LIGSTNRTPDHRNPDEHAVLDGPNREPVALDARVVSVYLFDELIGLLQFNWYELQRH
jgi:hypothetical protein